MATPIGNMGDITHRALEVLAHADRIAAEDTRTTARLLTRYGIRTPMLRHEKHNEAASAEGLVALLLAGFSKLVRDGLPRKLEKLGLGANEFLRAHHETFEEVLELAIPVSLLLAA